MTVAGPPKGYKPRAHMGAPRPAFDAAAISNPDAPATEKQIAFLRSLGKEREIGMTAEDFETMLDIWIAGDVCTKGFISEQIAEYQTKPKRPVKEPEPGYYTKGGKYYVVVLNKAKTHTYAKELITFPNGKVSWEYQSGAVRLLGDLTPLSIEEAAKWGHLHGKCIVCCRPLSDPESVKAGIGPVCAKRLKR